MVRGAFAALEPAATGGAADFFGEVARFGVDLGAGFAFGGLLKCSMKTIKGQKSYSKIRSHNPAGTANGLTF